MPSLRQQIERIYREKIASIERTRWAAIVGVIVLALGSLWGIEVHSRHQKFCAAVARNEMLEWQKGKKIDDLDYTFNELRAMFNNHYQKCMDNQ